MRNTSFWAAVAFALFFLAIGNFEVAATYGAASLVIVAMSEQP